jgi:hypothetical protein
MMPTTVSPKLNKKEDKEMLSNKRFDSCTTKAKE